MFFYSKIYSKYIDQISNFDYILDKYSFNTREIVSYAFKHKGRYFRSSLILAISYSYKILNEITFNSNIKNLCSSVELFHLATLVHDDCIDSSDFRRGAESIYSKYGVNNSILIGDLIFCSAFSISYNVPALYKDNRIFNLVNDMVQGELSQNVIKFDTSINFNSYYNIILNKTALFIAEISRCAFESAFFPKNKDNYSEIIQLYNIDIKDISDILYDFGLHLGIYFQMYDDFIDFKEFISCKTNSIFTSNTNLAFILLTTQVSKIKYKNIGLSLKYNFNNNLHSLNRYIYLSFGTEHMCLTVLSTYKYIFCNILYKLNNKYLYKNIMQLCDKFFKFI